jgi:hypothetical protein
MTVSTSFASNASSHQPIVKAGLDRVELLVFAIETRRDNTRQIGLKWVRIPPETPEDLERISTPGQRLARSCTKAAFPGRVHKREGDINARRGGTGCSAWMPNGEGKTWLEHVKIGVVGR